MIKQSINSSLVNGPVDIGVNIYFVLSDALRLHTMWERIGVSVNELTACRQSIHNLCEGINLSRLNILFEDMCSFILRLNRHLAVLNILLNNSGLNMMRFKLFATDLITTKFDDVYTRCLASKSGRRGFQMSKLPGSEKEFMFKGVNVVSAEDVEDIARYLRNDLNDVMLTGLYAEYIGNLHIDILKSINVRQFFTAFKNGNKVASEIMVLLYFNHNGIATIYKEDG